MNSQDSQRYHVKELHDGKYTFVNFSDRISAIDVKLFKLHSDFHSNEISEGGFSFPNIELSNPSTDSFFLTALNLWREYNHTQEFTEFSKQIFGYAKNLPMLLYHRDTVLEQLLQSLTAHERNQDVFKPLLSLIGYLAKDLKHFIFPKFFTIIEILVNNFLDPLDPANLEAGFIAVAYLFKYLQKLICSEEGSIIRLVALFKPLLFHKTEYLKLFSCQALSFLLKKVEPGLLPATLEALLQLFFSEWKTDPSTTNDDMALFFFEAINGIKGNFHSRALEICDHLVSIVLEKLSTHHTEHGDLRNYFSTLSPTVKINKNSVIPSHCELVFLFQLLFSLDDHVMSSIKIKYAKRFFLFFHQHLLSCLQEKEKNEDLIIQFYLIKYRRILAYKKGVIWDIPFDHGHGHSHGSDSNENHTEYSSFGDIVLSLLRFEQSPLYHAHANVGKNSTLLPLLLKLLKTIIRKHCKQQKEVIQDILAPVMNFLLTQLNASIVFHVLLIPLLLSSSSSIKDLLLPQVSKYLSLLFPKKMDIVLHILGALEVGRYKYRKGKDILLLSHLPINITLNIESSDKFIQALHHENEKTRLFYLIVTYKYIVPAPLFSVRDFVTQRWQLLSSTSSPNPEVEKMLFYSILMSFYNILSEIDKPFLEKCLVDLYLLFPDDSIALDLLLHFFSSFGTPPDYLIETLVTNLSIPELQPSSLHILALIFKSQHHPLVGVHEILLELVATTWDLHNERMLGMKLLNIHNCLLEHAASLDRIQIRILVFCLVALLKIKFTPLWTPASKSLGDLAKLVFPEFWTCFFLDIYIYHQIVNESDRVETNFDSDCILFRFSQLLHGTRVPTTDRTAFSHSLQKILIKLGPLIEKHSPAKHQIKNFFRYLYHRKFLCDNEFTNTSPSGPIYMEFLRYIDQCKDIKTIYSYLELCIHIFQQFQNPTSFQDLQEAIQSLVFSGPIVLQKISFELFLKFKPPAIIPYAESFRQLIDPRQSRNALTAFAFGDTDVVATPHFEEVSRFLVHLLYPLLKDTKSKHLIKHFKSIERKRAVIFNFFTSLSSDGISLLFNKFLNESKLVFVDNQLIQKKKIVSFVKLLQSFIKHLGQLLVPHLDAIFLILIRLLINLDDVASLLLKTLIILLESFPTYNFSQGLPERTVYISFSDPLTPDLLASNYLSSDLFISAITPGINRLDPEQFPTPPTSFHLCAALLHNFSHFPLPPEFVQLILRKSLPYLLVECVSLKGGKKNRARTLGAASSVTMQTIDIIQSFFDTQCISEMEISLLLATFESFIRNTKLPTLGGQALIVKGVVQMLLHLLPLITSLNNSTDLNARLFTIFVGIVNSNEMASNEPLLLECLSALRTCVPHAPSKMVQKMIPQLSNLFASLRSPQARQLVCQFFNLVPEHEHIALILQKLNSYQDLTYDFDSRTQAYSELTPAFLSTLTQTELYPLCHDSLFWAEDLDKLVSESATNVITTLIELAASSDYSTSSVVLDVVVPSLTRAFRLDSGVSSPPNPQHLRILSSLGKYLPVLFPDLFSLTRLEYRDTAKNAKKYLSLEKTSYIEAVSYIDKDVVVRLNFFECLSNISHHVKAISLKAFIGFTSKSISNTHLISLIIPIFSRFFFGLKFSDDFLPVLLREAICVATSSINWHDYARLLKFLLRFAFRSSSVVETMAMRLLCEILDHFHFPVLENIDDNEKLSASGNFVYHTLLPMLNAHLDKKNTYKNVSFIVKKKLIRQDTMNGTIALSIIKLLKHFPPSFSDIEIARVLTKICQNLKSREQVQRDTTRSSLQEIARFLGPPYFHFILKELVGCLTKGYQVHVLGYTVHSLLLNFDMSAADALLHIDPCIELMLPIFYGDIVGLTAEQKEVLKIKLSMVEASSIKSYDSFQLLSRIVSFQHSPVSPNNSTKSLLEWGGCGKILDFISQKLENTSLLAIIRKWEAILFRVAAGLYANPSFIDPAQRLLVIDFILDTLQKHLPITPTTDITPILETFSPKRVSAYQSSQEGQMLLPKATTERPLPRWVKHVEHPLLATFALQLFLKLAKQNHFASADGEVKLHLEELVLQAVPLLNSSHQSLVLISLKALVRMLKMRLGYKKTKLPDPSVTLDSLLKTEAPSVKTINDQIAPKLCRKCIMLMKNTRNLKEITQQCFKILAILLLEVNNFDLTEKQLAFVLKIALMDFEKLDFQGSAFVLFKAILLRQVIAPSVYDLIIQIQEVMVQASLPSVRAHAAYLLFIFLHNYPLDPHRFQQHLDFLVHNLKYPYPSGRLAILDMIQLLIKKFPPPVLSLHASFFMLPLLLSIHGDEDKAVREVAGTTLKLLFAQVDPTTAEGLWNIHFGFLEQGGAVGRVAVQTLGLWIELYSLRSSLIKKHLSSIISLLYNNHCEQLLSKYEQNENDSDTLDKDTEEDWELLYLCFHVFEKILIHIPQPLLLPLFSPLWKKLVQGLFYPHRWIRHITSRLLHLQLKTISHKAVIKALTKGDSSLNFFGDPIQIFTLLQGICSIFSTSNLTIDNAKVTLKNLVVLGQILLRCPHLPLPNATNSTDEKNSHAILHWLFRRLSFTARRAKTPIQKEYIFKWFAFMVNAMDPSILTPFLLPILSPLYTVSTDTRKSNAELNTLATELLEFIKKRIGALEFFEQYNSIRQEHTKSKLERKKKRMLEGVLDPSKAAHRRMKKTHQRKLSKKRKMANFK